MKRILFLTSCVLILASSLVGCGGKTASSSSSKQETVSSTPAPVDSSAPASVESTSEGSSIKDIANAIIPAADLQAEIDVDILLLTESGDVSADKIEQVAGKRSAQWIENGGIVMVIKAKTGMAQEVEKELQAYKDAQVEFLALYPEFEAGVANTKEARIVVRDDIVVYAVAANGDFESLDAAISDALAM